MSDTPKAPCDYLLEVLSDPETSPGIRDDLTMILRQAVLRMPGSTGDLDNLGNEAMKRKLAGLLADLVGRPEARAQVGALLRSRLDWRHLECQATHLLMSWQGQIPSRDLALFCGVRRLRDQGGTWLYEGSCSIQTNLGRSWWAAEGEGSRIMLRSYEPARRRQAAASAAVAESGLRRAALACPELAPLLPILRRALEALGVDALPGPDPQEVGRDLVMEMEARDGL